jgi:hypothetical protein
MEISELVFETGLPIRLVEKRAGNPDTHEP